MQGMPLIDKKIKSVYMTEDGPGLRTIGIVPEDISVVDTIISQAVMDSVPRSGEVVLDAATH